MVATADAADASNSLMIRHVLEVNDGIWLAVRAYGVDQAVAHSAPVYVTTDGGFEKASAVPAIARRMIDKLSEFETLQADEKLELEAWSVREPLTEMVAEQRQLILERASEARAIYLRMLDSY